MPSRLCRAAFVLACAASLPAARAAEVHVTSERRINFNDDWRFFKGEADGAELPAFNDSKWRTLGCRTTGRSKVLSIPRRIRTRARCQSSGPAGIARRSRCRRPRRASTSASSSTARWPIRTVWLNGQRTGRAPIRLHRLLLRPHALLAVRRGGERAGGAAGAGGPVVALVSGRGDLPQRLARHHRRRCTWRAGARM